ncbi:hypothetical protein AB0H34_18505 [Saccharopolyspora shandongensis]|uniref:hypothetical protein n=1 Tax=Saccharopolyspora shandongensis TaxID=418495 RepID=UPI0033F85BD0
MDGQEDAAATSEDGRAVPPARRGSRDERREATLRALAAGEEAHCAYCGQALPPLPPRGGRPTPYCPADPDRYGHWGAKTITCAMLDEHREIWVQVYGPDQPMTHLDVHTLDQRLTALLAVLDPVRAEVAALQAHTTGELNTALTARETAEADRRHAVHAVRTAEAARDEALAQATQAREEAEAARTEQAAAAEQAGQAAAARDQALAERSAAHQEAEAARTDRQQALDQVAAAHQRIADLQTTLASERATALERLDQLRREEAQARQELRTDLAEEWQQRLTGQAEGFTQKLQDVQATADQRITELTSHLTQSTEAYAKSLAPLHDQVATLRSQLAEQTKASTSARQGLRELHDSLAHVLHHATADDTLREQLQTVLDGSTTPPTPDASPN